MLKRGGPCLGQTEGHGSVVAFAGERAGKAHVDVTLCTREHISLKFRFFKGVARQGLGVPLSRGSVCPVGVVSLWAVISGWAAGGGSWPGRAFTPRLQRASRSRRRFCAQWPRPPNKMTFNGLFKGPQMEN